MTESQPTDMHTSHNNSSSTAAPPSLVFSKANPDELGGLVEAAQQPGADICDIACENMPAHILHDLTPRDDAWLVQHADSCGYCAGVLHRYERVDDMLDRLQIYLDPAQTPPKFVIPTASKFSRTSSRSRVNARAARPVTDRRIAHYTTLESPLGLLRIAVSDTGVAEIGYSSSESEDVFRKRLAARGFDLVPATGVTGAGDPARTGKIAAVARQLQEYFGGGRNHFDLPIDFTGVSPFTRSVLSATADIPFGEVSTYGEIAARIGSPGASRAVGNALGRNPIPVIVPCHRIIRSNGSIGWYTGGVKLKERLLAIEGVKPRDLGMK